MSVTAAVDKPRGLYYHGWNVVAATVLAQSIGSGFAVTCLSLFLKDWSAQFHAPVSTLVSSIFLMTIFACLISPLVGIWSDKYSARRLFGIGIAGVAVFLVLISFTTAAWQVLVLYGLFLPIPMCLSTTVPSNTLISRWFVRRLGLAIGISSFGLGAAGMVLPPLIAHLLPIYGWQMIWRGAAVFCVAVIFPLVLIAVRNRPDPQRDGVHYLTPDTSGGGAAKSAHGHGPAPAAAGASALTLRDVFKRRAFWMLLLTILPVEALHTATGTNLAPYAAAHGLSPEAGGLLMSILFGFNLAGMLLIGGLADRFGNRVPLALAIIMGAAGCAAMAFGTGFFVIAVGCALLGLVGGVFTLLGAGIGAAFGAEGFGRAFGAVMLFMPLMAFAPVAIAKVQESTGSYAIAFMGMAALLIIPVVLLATQRSTPPAATPLGGVMKTEGAS